MRRSFSAGFKRKVALAALRGDRTRAEVAGVFQVHPHQVMMWKKQVLQVLPEVFSYSHHPRPRHTDRYLPSLDSSLHVSGLAARSAITVQHSARCR